MRKEVVVKGPSDLSGRSLVARRQPSALTFGVYIAALLAALLLVPNSAFSATTVPSGFSNARVVSGLDSPTAMEFAPDGRIFVSEQAGKLRVIQKGKLLSTPFINLTNSIDSDGERGLLGIAFDPDFGNNHHIYLYYTKKGTSADPVHNNVVRYTANGDRVVPGSGKVILRLNDLSSATNHNGGAIHFGKDGKLYVAVGENAHSANSQTLSNLLGKMLRINKDGTIPTGNPFYNQATGQNRAIWALGLRNPYTFDFKRGSTKMYINDVGYKTWEEINAGIAGSNYGWPVYEGPESDPQYRSPIYAYRHGDTDTMGCAITGGAFYDPVSDASRTFGAAYQGDYFFADFCGGWIRKYDPSTDKATGFATGISWPVDLKVSKNGSLYYLARHTGSVYRISRVR